MNEENNIGEKIYQRLELELPLLICKILLESRICYGSKESLKETSNEIKRVTVRTTDIINNFLQSDFPFDFFRE